MKWFLFIHEDMPPTDVDLFIPKDDQHCETVIFHTNKDKPVRNTVSPDPRHSHLFAPKRKDSIFMDSMAHVMFHVGLFPSISQAKKNGWNKPIQDGYSDFVIGKNKREILIWNTFGPWKNIREELLYVR